MKANKLFLSIFTAIFIFVATANAQNHPIGSQTLSLDNNHTPEYSLSSVSGVLYSQLDSTSGNGYASQQFPDFSNDIGSSADEFVVPSGVTWSIDSVDCIGQFQAAHPTGPMISVRVLIWNDSANAGIRPGSLVYADSNIIPITGLTNPSPTFKLHHLAILDPGKYWFSIVVLQNFTTAGQWYWNARPTRGAPCVFRDQANLFGGGTQWHIISTPPNQAVCFRLRGVIGPIVPLPPFFCNTYNFTTITGSPGPTGHNAGMTVPIGFIFNYLTISYSQVWICTNGFIRMGPTGGTSPVNNLCGTSDTTTLNVLAPFWDDLNPDNGGNIQYTTFGTAPHRIFIVQFSDVAYSSGTGTVTFQVKFYETYNVIDFSYGPSVPNLSATGHIGINLAPGGPNYFIDITPGVNCGSTTYSTTTCTSVPYNIPPGTYYRFGETLSGINNNNNFIPNIYTLEQNYPNPFNPTTVVKYGLPKAGLVKIVVYDILGREVKTLVNEFKQAGSYNVSFDASSLASGVYLYKIESRQAGSSTGDFSQTKKMLLVK